jgi:allene oxide cyclase
MRGKRATLVAAAVVSATAIVLSIATVSAAGPGVTKIHVIEHADTDTVVDTGGTTGDDTTGDLLTFANDVYDASDTNVVGSDQGECVRIVPGESWECRWVTLLDGGSITVEGPFYDAGDSVLAVTGGTGAYKGAQGTMKLIFHNPEGTAFDFEFRLLNG